MLRQLLAVCLLAGAGSPLKSADRTFQLPCEIASASPSGDGNAVWVACFIRKTDKSGKPLNYYQSTSLVYSVNVSTGRVTQILSNVGVITVSPAQVGDKVIVVVPRERSNGKAILFSGSVRSSIDLSFVDPGLIVWGADGQRLYFYGGSTLQADAWNILGLLRLNDVSASKTTLSEPTEDVYVCSRTGHVYTGLPGFDTTTGHLAEAHAVEYDANLRRVGKAPFPPGAFSAGCRYIATPSSWHGPIPWRIVETANAREVIRFAFTGGEENREEFEFSSWNPKLDAILLRTRYYRDSSGKEGTELQVFDIVQRRVIESLADDPERNPVWSADGRSIIMARGHSLILHPVSLPNK